MSNQLTSLIIPNSVTSIGLRAFAYNKLTEIIFPSTPLTIECHAFGNNPITNVGNYTYPDNVSLGPC